VDGAAFLAITRRSNFFRPPQDLGIMVSQIDWYYHRTGCKTCGKMDALLEQQGLESKETVSAHKQKFDFETAKKMLAGITRIVASKGTKPVEIDLRKDAPTDDELKAILIGPSGNLRAPAIRRGKTLLIGFHEETFAPVLAGK